MPDHQLKIYLGGTKFGDRREANVRALALKYFPKHSGKEGNISALFNDALNKVYNLTLKRGRSVPALKWSPMLPSSTKICEVKWPQEGIANEMPRGS